MMTMKKTLAILALAFAGFIATAAPYQPALTAPLTGGDNNYAWATYLEAGHWTAIASNSYTTVTNVIVTMPATDTKVAIWVTYSNTLEANSDALTNAVNRGFDWAFQLGPGGNVWTSTNAYILRSMTGYTNGYWTDLLLVTNWPAARQVKMTYMTNHYPFITTIKSITAGWFKP